MFNDKHCKNENLFESIKRKEIIAKKSSRLTQNLCEFDNVDVHNHHNLRSTAECKSHLLQSPNFLSYHGHIQKKFVRQQRRNAKKQKTSLQQKRAVSVGRATVPITPQMIRVAVKELQTRRVYISSALIACHLRRCYPIENDADALKEELKEKLNCAVSVGLIAKCGNDKYCIPTLRQQASLNKTAVTAFWDTYYGSSVPPTMGQLINLRIPRIRAYKKNKYCFRTQL